jgi:GR25 family glycosyltransferase involved in LPS biosynthesis
MNALTGVESINWQFLDKIYLITTNKSDQNRLAQTKATLEKVGLLDKLEIKTFPTDDENRVRGCYTSHIKVLEEIKKQLSKKSDYRALILEDNIEVTPSMNPSVLKSVEDFMKEAPMGSWDVFHLAYMMYVPGLNLNQLNRNQFPGLEELQQKEFATNIVQMIAEKSAVVGTSAYVVSKTGVEKLLTYHKNNGFREAIPNIMAELFPSTRFACYPMVFHRAGTNFLFYFIYLYLFSNNNAFTILNIGKVNSLVNPQLDSFRRVMFNPMMYTNWERLMVSTGLQNNQLFPGLTISLLIGIVAGIIASFQSSTNTVVSSVDLVGTNNNLSSSSIIGSIVLAFPLLVAIWGATLFRPGNKGAGFAQSAKK